jgi:hypothetical protein
MPERGVGTFAPRSKKKEEKKKVELDFLSFFLNELHESLCIRNN